LIDLVDARFHRNDKKPSDDPYYARLVAYLDTLNAETGRGRALIAASLIEKMLEEVLRAHTLDEAATSMV